MAISSATVAGLRSGVLVAASRATRTRRLRRLAALQRDFDLIAATAHAYDARPYTRNASDLIDLEDLVEIVPI
ncbi:hypothetical protein [Nocardia vaccinii]|uniref:hypothetical protein n=1 Tax=Nocardia vaccinii TaxID=1822 RepID=UPI000A848FE6|nr:hypothetical protein [Nocardia vaccinii]